MTTRNAALAALLIEALETAATDAAGASAQLVTVAIEMLKPSNFGTVRTSITRKTRTLIFAEAALLTEAGERVALATSVHKIPEPA